MERAEALSILDRHVHTDTLRKHCLATAAVMRELAEKLGQDTDTWEVVGLLHDVDFEQVDGNMDRHGLVGARILIDEGVDAAIADVVRRHNHLLHGDYTSPVEKALQSADSVSGLVIACALVKGGRISEVTTKTVRKKFKEKSFAAGCDRSRILAIEPLIDPETLYECAICGLTKIKDELELS